MDFLELKVSDLKTHSDEHLRNLAEDVRKEIISHRLDIMVKAAGLKRHKDKALRKTLARILTLKNQNLANKESMKS